MKEQIAPELGRTFDARQMETTRMEDPAMRKMVPIIVIARVA